MELTNIEINNFRSIKSEVIEMKHNCLVFVGKNEAGKSNILKAIAGGLSQKAVGFTERDKRNLLNDEDYENQNYCIDYEFKLKPEEIKEGLKNIDSSVLVAKKGTKTFTLVDFFSQYFSRTIYRYNFEKKTSSYLYYIIKDIEMLDIGIIKTPFTHNGKNYTVNSLVNFDNLDEQHLVNCQAFSDIRELESFCKEKMEAIMKPLLPTVHYWEYSKDLLIPDSVTLQTFIDNPASCRPLRNIFELAGVENITKAFQETKKQCGDYDNLLDRVSKQTTLKIRESWPDLNKISIILSENSQEIRVKIQEKIKQNVSARSDGFKKFISILCMLASPIEKGKIKNSVIVLDEPDSGLYPTGAGYLRDMLIQMSDSNVVFYSTHNPCMIDKTTIDRHIIVEKNDDITKLKTDLSDSKFRDDEVLLRAIGMSAFENIKETNIIFEGWTDYRVFNTALNSNKEGYKTTIKCLLESGNSYGNGTNSLKYFISMVKLLDKKTYVILDADKEGQDKKATLQKEFPEEKIYTLDDLGYYRDYTLEDFIKEDLIQKAIISIGSDKKIKDKGEQKVMQFLSSLSKQDKQDFKTYIGKHIQVSDIQKEYFEMLKKIKEKIEQTDTE